MINLISQRNAKTFHGSICETSISYIRLKDFMYKQLSVAADTADTDSATEVFWHSGALQIGLLLLLNGETCPSIYCLRWVYP